MRYRVDFYDMIDGWIKINQYEFDDLEEAKSKCNILQDELDDANKKAGEHWGVIDLEKGREIYCTMK